jgi:hypothetical protein
MHPLHWIAHLPEFVQDIAIVVGVILGFNFMRRHKLFSDFYQPKRKLSIPFRCATYRSVSRLYADAQMPCICAP